MQRLTILTPTYNRANQLPDLFRSLQSQTEHNFIWMIVDDGSTDDTADAVERMQETAVFPVVYIRKTNGGKHTALNTGIAQIETELTFIVDSDDALTEDAVALVLSYAHRYEKTEGICGFVFLRCFPDGTINGKPFQQENWKTSYVQSRINANDTMADKAEVFYTRCLREFPFPEFPGEKFLGEDIVWIRMGRCYEMIHINRKIYVGTYQVDGLTRNRRRKNIESPMGCTHRAQEFMKKDLRLRYRLKGAMQYVIYGTFARKDLRWLMKNSTDPLLTTVCMPAAAVLYRKWKREYERG